MKDQCSDMSQNILYKLLRLWGWWNFPIFASWFCWEWSIQTCFWSPELRPENTAIAVQLIHGGACASHGSPTETCDLAESINSVVFFFSSLHSTSLAVVLEDAILATSTPRTLAAISSLVPFKSLQISLCCWCTILLLKSMQLQL